MNIQDLHCCLKGSVRAGWGHKSVKLLKLIRDVEAGLVSLEDAEFKAFAIALTSAKY